MAIKTALAVGVVAAFSTSFLLAQGQATSSANNPSLPPRLMHLCIAGCSAGKGSTLDLDNGRYADKTAPNVVYTIERFTPELVVIHLKRDDQYGGTAILRGQISKDGNSVVNGTIQWTSHPCCGLTTGPFRAAWGAAIATVPGENKSSQPYRGNVSTIPPCNAQAKVTPEEAYQYGTLEIRFQEPRAGVCWLEKASNLGSDKAQSSLAVILYRGMFGVSRDPARAFDQAQKAAMANNPLGELCLAMMYAAGDGIPQDADKAQYWKAKSQKDGKQQNGGDVWSSIFAHMGDKTPSGVTGWQALESAMGFAQAGIDSASHDPLDDVCKKSPSNCKAK